MSRLTPAERRMYAEFCQEFTQCWACVVRADRRRDDDRQWWILDIAHIVGGSGRRADRRAIARLCRPHHDVFDGTRHAGIKSITLENVVWLKQEFDPANLDIDFLRSLRHKHALPIHPLPMD